MDPEEIRRLTTRFRDAESAFLRDYNAHLTQLPDNELKQLLTNELYPVTLEYFRLVREEYLPLVGKSDQKTLTRFD